MLSCCPVWSTRMSTSASPATPNGRALPTATRAAAAGGVTTLVDMPLDSVPTTVTVAALEVKRQAAEGQCHVDVGFWGGVIPGNLDDLVPLHEAGVLGFKCFLADSGSDDFPPARCRPDGGGDAGPARPRVAAARSRRERGRRCANPAAHGRDYADYLASRPRGVENIAVAQVIEGARSTGAWAHVLHLSSSDALPMIASAKREGVALTAESCPHYLALTAEEIGPGETAFKCSPPVREAANRELLWQGLAAGEIDLIVSDHSPCTVAMKELESGDFGAAWGGISSLQLGLPIVWTEARRRGVSLAAVARLDGAAAGAACGTRPQGADPAGVRRGPRGFRAG